MESLIEILFKVSLDPNFFSIDLGLILAGIGLAISGANYFYSKPKIKIYRESLFIESFLIANEQNTLENLINRTSDIWINFYLEIFIRNEKGGDGSITKPILEIKIREKMFKWKPIQLPPTIEHHESERVDDHTTSSWTVRDGAAYNLSASSYLDDMLKYNMRIGTKESEKETLKLLASPDVLKKYTLIYFDNKGNKRTKRIREIKDMRDRNLF